jgi:hypothetical protein
MIDGKKVLESADFLDLDEPLAQKMLMSERLNAPEITIYERTIEWAKQEIAR